MKKRIKDNLEKVPKEILEYWRIMAITGGMMGRDMYRRCQEIIDNNPLWFVWEHKYKSVPQEVHNAYKKETRSGEWFSIDTDIKKESFIGLIPTLKNRGTVYNYPSEKSLEELLTEFGETYSKEQKRKFEQGKKDKALWDKYYKKYNLEYRKD